MDICVLALSKVCIIYIAYIYSKESDYNKFYKLINFFYFSDKKNIGIIQWKEFYWDMDICTLISIESMYYTAKI